ncbi:hypothetical protein ABZW67_22750 [Streptomyces rubiginosohelvolus]
MLTTPRQRRGRNPGAPLSRAHRSAGGDHFLAFTSVACTLIRYRRLAN